MGILVGVRLHPSLYEYPRSMPDTRRIGNLKEETRGTQFRQVRAAMCVIPYVLYAA
jgi:hypothetical protein